jgi:hypothetical protein
MTVEVTVTVMAVVTGTRRAEQMTACITVVVATVNQSTDCCTAVTVRTGIGMFNCDDVTVMAVMMLPSWQPAQFVRDGVAPLSPVATTPL